MTNFKSKNIFQYSYIVETVQNRLDSSGMALGVYVVFVVFLVYVVPS